MTFFTFGKMGTMEFARMAGGKVIAMDINAQRLRFCQDKLKVAHTINASYPDVGEQLKEITSGDMPTVVMDSTGSQKAINNAFQFVAHDARYVLIGLQRGEISRSHPEFHKREGTLMSRSNAIRQDFGQVITALKKKEIDPSAYITHRIFFYKVVTEFVHWLNPETGVIKV